MLDINNYHWIMQFNISGNQKNIFYTCPATGRNIQYYRQAILWLRYKLVNIVKKLGFSNKLLYLTQHTSSIIRILFHKSNSLDTMFNYQLRNISSSSTPSTHVNKNSTGPFVSANVATRISKPIKWFS